MNEDRYLIKEAALKVGVETHVLRYWEEELKMEIHRNEMGHRYYTHKDIEVLKKVKELKERGLQLKAIRNYLEMRKKQLAQEASQKTEQEANKELVEVHTAGLTNSQKMEQFQTLMNRIVANAIAENNELIGKSAGEHAADMVVSKINGMTKEQEQRAEERFQKLDQTLREIQKARMEAAASSMRPVDKRKQARLKRNSCKPAENKIN